MAFFRPVVAVIQALNIEGARVSLVWQGTTSDAVAPLAPSYTGTEAQCQGPLAQ